MEIAQNVIKELIEMGLIKDKSLVESFFTRWVPWGNVIFNHDYKGKEVDEEFNNSLVYMPSLANMSDEEMNYLSHKINLFEEMVD